MNSLAKIFDSLVYKKLYDFFKPMREQAGAQKFRGCIENIVSLRFIFHYALKRKITLFVLFIDYSSAFDKIPRLKLLQCLHEFGFPSSLINVIPMIYKKSSMPFHNKYFDTNAGVRQGAPTSAFFVHNFYGEIHKKAEISMS